MVEAISSTVRVFQEDKPHKCLPKKILSILKRFFKGIHDLFSLKRKKIKAKPISTPTVTAASTKMASTPPAVKSPEVTEFESVVEKVMRAGVEATVVKVKESAGDLLQQLLEVVNKIGYDKIYDTCIKLITEHTESMLEGNIPQETIDFDALVEDLTDALMQNINSDHIMKKETLKSLLQKALGKMVDEITHKESLDRLITKAALPAIQDTLKRGLIRDYMSENPTATLEEVQIKFSDIDSELIKHEYSHIPSKVEFTVNPGYAKLIENIVLKHGKFGSLATKYASYNQEYINEVVSEAAAELQKSPNYLIKKITEGLCRNLTNVEKLQEILFSKPKPVETVEMHREVKKTAQIAHRLIMQKASRKGFLKKQAVNFIIGYGTAHLEKVIWNIYENLLSDEQANKHLLSTVLVPLTNRLKQLS